jgi:hypothetical protein
MDTESRRLEELGLDIVKGQLDDLTLGMLRNGPAASENDKQ